VPCQSPSTLPSLASGGPVHLHQCAARAALLTRVFHVLGCNCCFSNIQFELPPATLPSYSKQQVQSFLFLPHSVIPIHRSIFYRPFFLSSLAYKPYFFSKQIIIFSHTKSTNGTFSHNLSTKQDQTNKAYLLCSSFQI